MKFGIFIFGDNHPELGRSNQKYYEEVLTMADWAEELSFDSFWLGEHHLYWYGTCVSPPMLIAAIGQRTKRIRLGPAIAVPSFHNPLILAEEYALADNLCNGRLEFALGSGFSPVEFQQFGMSMEEAKEKFWEGSEIILKAWQGETFSYHGKHYNFDNISLYMQPLQKPMPPTWLAASSDETLVKAGQMGLPMMGIPFARSNNLADVKAKHDLYTEAFAKAGHAGTPEIMVAMPMYLHPDEHTAVDNARPYFERNISFHKTHRRPGSKIPQLDNIKQERLALFTTPEDTVAILREYEKIGVTHVIGIVNFGGVPMPDVRRTLELMSKRVFAKFR
jgi:alkanesulfonate monooxygenase SsuD/methylene tetrahydromethanopterin reductase-like flavin-dependent oxidoreductase (luciferase family)